MSSALGSRTASDEVAEVAAGPGTLLDPPCSDYSDLPRGRGALGLEPIETQPASAIHKRGHPLRRRSDVWLRKYRLLAIGVDAVLAWVAATTAVLLRYDPSVTMHGVPYLVLAAAFPFLWVASQAVARSYENGHLGVGPDEFKRIVRAGIGLTAAICFVWSTAQLNLSRIVVGLSLPLATFLTLLGRFALRKALHRIRRSGRASNRVLVLGSRNEVYEFVKAIRRAPQAGFLPVGMCLTRRSGRVDLDGPTLPVMGGLDDVLRAVKALDADTVAICGDRGVSTEGLRRLAWDLQGTGIGLVVAPALTDVAGPRIHIRPVAGLPMLHVEEPVLRGAGHAVKTTFDRTASAAGLVLLSPLLLLIAVVVVLGSPGPVFFRQSRIGRNAEPFRVWKFRTMYIDAEDRLTELLADNESDGLLFKLRHDPRITPFGRWLRRYSLDELPQLLNVLSGDMSLIGPRPLPTKAEDYRGKVRRRLLVRPGITGLWQVSGRSTLSWEESVRLDLYYVDNWSLMADFMILWKTLFVVFRGAGAY